MESHWSLGTWLLALDWAIRVAALLWIPSRTTSAAARSWCLTNTATMAASPRSQW